MASEAASFETYEIIEAYRELQRLELALVKERERNSQIEEEQRIAAESHARDVGCLEEMLEQVLAENQRLSAQLAEKKSGEAPLKSLEEIRAMYEIPAEGAGGASQWSKACECEASSPADWQPGCECEEPEVEPRRGLSPSPGVEGADV